MDLRSSGWAELNIIMAPEGDYNRLALKAAKGEELPGEESKKITRSRHPAEVGSELFSVKNYAGALEKFQEALAMKEGENDPDLYFALARTQYELGQYDQAAVSLQRVGELEKGERPLIYYYRALIADKQGRTQEAIGFLEKEIAASKKSSAPMLSILGSLYRSIGETDKAIVTLEKSIALNPNNANTLINLGALYSGEGDQREAEVYFQMAVEAGASGGQDGAVVFFNLGALNYNQSEFRTAAEAYERAVSLRPNYASAHRELGYTYRELGELAKAREHFQKYLELVPEADDKAKIAALVSYLEDK